ncbi:PREDICTED: uncharacterized protein LOC105363622 [Ceratosolen solmsi marchali]|uniref:Uncharacterized protein LOC105363622 n=1 Tax=Ceratosolen solmsi marchali TaxID=326594 RepID=A0AAJ6YKD1_9HYME|nr:PREDICTED: uncharacterized protein LOC105363622 [Ceratosolen solmsi marchali]
MLSENDFVRTTLIHGDAELCKTFLFEAAISWAKDGHQVCYISSRQLQCLPPTLHDRSEPSAEALKLITFMSVGNYEELADQLVELHTFRKPPSVLLIDDLDLFAANPGIRGCSREVHVARCCALVLHAAFSCSRVTNCPIQVCAASFEATDYETIYCKYFDNRWLLNAEVGESSTEEGRRVWVKRPNGSQTFEFCRLDDAVLVLRRILVAELNPSINI